MRKSAIGALVIGDEILVGKRQDKHLSFLIGALARRGLRLAYCEIQGDDPERLTAALRRSFAAGEIVFSFGGIGATPDDHTRECVAAALAVPLKLHPEAEREIRARFPAVERIALVQRVGYLDAGVPTTVVAVSSPHRDQGCFEAARYGIETAPKCGKRSPWGWP